MKYSLRKYIDSTEVMNRVSASLKSYADADLILFDEYYKVIDLCNQRMGFRLNPTKEALIKLENGRADLPIDFLLLNVAIAVTSEIEVHNLPVSKTEYLTGECPTLKDLQQLENKCCDFKLECGKKPILTCQYEQTKIEFKYTYIARLTEKKYCSTDCFNLNVPANHSFLMEITNNQIFIDGITEGYIYLQYQAQMKEDGNLPMCLDNEIILNYYEQAIKYEILQDLYINKRLEIAQALQLVEKKLIMAKNEALALVRMPEFQELQQIGNFLRKLYRKNNYIIY